MAQPEAPKVERQTLRQGRNKIVITTTTDAARGIERTELVITKGKRTSHHVIERDLATGKLLQPEALGTSAPNWRDRLREELAALKREE